MSRMAKRLDNAALKSALLDFYVVDSVSTEKSIRKINARKRHLYKITSLHLYKYRSFVDKKKEDELKESKKFI
jgi:hypothetical protein